MTAQWSSRETRNAGNPLPTGGASTNNVAAENVWALSGEHSHLEFVVIGADRTAFFQVRATDSLQQSTDQPESSDRHCCRTFLTVYRDILLPVCCKHAFTLLVPQTPLIPDFGHKSPEFCLVARLPCRPSSGASLTWRKPERKIVTS